MSIRPAPEPGPIVAADAPSFAPFARPVATPMPVPPGAGAPHAAGLADDVALGIGLVGVGALGVAALGTAGAFEGLGFAARPAIDFVAKAGPRYVADLRSIGREYDAVRRDPELTGSFLARKTADALVDAPGAAIVGGAFSAGAAIAWHFIEAARAPHAR